MASKSELARQTDTASCSIFSTAFCSMCDQSHMQHSSSLHLSVVSCLHDSQEDGLVCYVNAIHYVHCTLLTTFVALCVRNNFLRHVAYADDAVPCVNVISLRCSVHRPGASPCLWYKTLTLACHPTLWLPKPRTKSAKGMTARKPARAHLPSSGYRHHFNPSDCCCAF